MIQLAKLLFILGILTHWNIVAYADENIVTFYDIESAAQYVHSLNPSDYAADTKKAAILAYLARTQLFSSDFQIDFEVEMSHSSTSKLTTQTGQQIINIGLHYPGCIAIYNIDSSTFMSTMTSTNTSDPNLEGICVLLSVIHSVVNRLELVNPEDVFDKDGNIKKAVLVDLKMAAGNWLFPGVNTNKNQTLHEVLAKKKFTCSNPVRFNPTTLDSDCKQLRDYIHSGYDCNLFLRHQSNGGERRIGHAVNIMDVTPMGKDLCVFSNADTHEQGDGKGNNVPSEPGYQRWSITNHSWGLELFNAEGKNTRIFNAQRYNGAWFQCCKAEQ